ncbi:DUF1295 domain-containing protein [Pseudomonas sp. gcc21]|uniref:methyltransferase family protein n=1 Tax=Pseudomonas sp. gcc21 TaxID=2726989 RepID=UPI0014511E81|nr:methyltransferase [Pseudomonas sp. gcc21]QJD60357.1 DUF1295 domain-containing protein [Pseudomonas sp. gcc21]
MTAELHLQAAILPLFILLSIALAWVCRRQLLNPRCHGFYRFFAFEGILWLFLNALPLWHHEMFSMAQIASLLLMLLALGLVAGGVHALRRHGGASVRQQAEENFAFENTSTLVTQGVFAYIRHPMYTSLLLLNWGLVLKRAEPDAIVIALVVSAALYLTARAEEQENHAFFGPCYRDYSKRSGMFLPMF